MHLFCYSIIDDAVEHVFALKCRQAVHDETIVNEVEVAAVANAVVNVVVTAVVTAEVTVAEAAVEPAVDVIVIGMLNFVSVERIWSRD